MNTLCWSLTKNNGDKTDFFPFMYDMYYLSMVMAKSLGYRTVLYGNSNAISKLREVCDEVINIDFLDYQFFDDPKVYIWATREGDYATIDGDVFIYKRLDVDEESLFEKPFDLMVEEFQPLNDWDKDLGRINPDAPIPHAWKLFNSQNPSNCIFEWRYYAGTDSYNSGLVYWKNKEFRKYYVENYYKLRKWYIDRREFFHQNSRTMKVNVSISSHFICEHLMRRLVHYYSLNVKSFNHTQPKSYTHLVGSDKFVKPDHYVGIALLVNEIKEFKKLGFLNHKLNIEKIYTELAKLHKAIE